MQLQALNRVLVVLGILSLFTTWPTSSTAFAALMASSGAGGDGSASAWASAESLCRPAPLVLANETVSQGSSGAKQTLTPLGVGSSASAKRSTSEGERELETARRILERHVAKHPILNGATIAFGDARGYQAISYYQSGRIVIDRNHRASLERIIGHEIWHIIDWRDNGRIDWGENVPPR